MVNSALVRKTVLAASIAVAVPASAYIHSYPSFETMRRESDVVVVATPIERVEIRTPAELPGVKGDGKPIPAVAIHTTFRVSTSLTGPLAQGDELVLLHHRRRDPQTGGIIGGVPLLVDFKPNDGSQWLMFLKHGPGATYVAFHPVEPGWCVVQLALQDRE